MGNKEKRRITGSKLARIIMVVSLAALLIMDIADTIITGELHFDWLFYLLTAPAVYLLFFHKNTAEFFDSLLEKFRNRKGKGKNES